MALSFGTCAVGEALKSEPREWAISTAAGWGDADPKDKILYDLGMAFFGAVKGQDLDAALTTYAHIRAEVRGQKAAAK